MAAADQDLAALLLDLLDGCEVVFARTLGDQRPHEGVLVQRIADGDGGVGLDQLADDLVGDAVVQEEPAQGGAALARGADGGEEDGTDGQVQAGVGLDDDGVVAAQLEDGAAEAAGDGLGDVPTHLGGTGERDERNPWVVQHALAHRTAGADDGVEHAPDVVAIHDLVADVLHRDGGQRGGGGGLPHHGVAAHRCQGGIPRPHGHREIEGRDDADDAQRMPLLVHAVAGAFGHHVRSADGARQADGVVAHVDHLLNFTQALGQDLAHLEGDQCAERVLLGAQGVPEFADDLATLGGRHHAPAREGALGGVHHRFVGVGVGLDDLGDGGPVGGIQGHEFPGLGRHDPLARAGAQIGLFHAELAENRRSVHCRFLLQPVAARGSVPSGSSSRPRSRWGARELRPVGSQRRRRRFESTTFGARSGSSGRWANASSQSSSSRRPIGR
jgi:hypothetical protein